MLVAMSEVTRILSAIDQGDPHAAGQLLPLVYDELRRFAAAAEAMRRILVESARRKQRLKHGGGMHRQELREDDWMTQAADDRLLTLDEALRKLAVADAPLAELVRLRYFA